jgi:hypothetical protein
MGKHRKVMEKCGKSHDLWRFIDGKIMENPYTLSSDTGEWEMFLISSIRSKNKDVVFAHSRNVRLNMNR